MTIPFYFLLLFIGPSGEWCLFWGLGDNGVLEDQLVRLQGRQQDVNWTAALGGLGGKAVSDQAFGADEGGRRKKKSERSARNRWGVKRKCGLCKLIEAKETSGRIQ